MVILDPYDMTFDAVGVFGLAFYLLFRSWSTYCGGPRAYSIHIPYYSKAYIQPSMAAQAWYNWVEYELLQCWIQDVKWRIFSRPGKLGSGKDKKKKNSTGLEVHLEDMFWVQKSR